MDKRKWMVRAVSIILAMLMIGTLLIPLMMNVFAEGLGGTAVDGNNAQTGTAAPPASSAQTGAAASSDKKGDELRAQVEEHRKAAEEYARLAKESEKNAANAQQTKLYYEQQATALAAQIEAQKLSIAHQEDVLAAKQEELAAQVIKVDQAQNDLEQRLKAMYEISRTSQLSVMLGLDSFADMLTYNENLTRISESDDRLVKNLQQEKALMEQQAADIQTALDDLNAQKEEMENLNAQYAAAIQKAASDALAAQQQAEAYTQYSEAEMQKMKDAQAEWAAWASSSTNVEYWDGGTFQWPLPGYTRISSDFGTTRVIYGVKDVHRGMDIPAPAGTPIYAACDGVVSTKAHWSYGTCVKLSINSSMVLIYGHMSARYVNDGDVVTRGQKIGAVGSTGNSTGNHLHFELDVNGSPTSLRQYLDPAIESQLHF